LFENIDIYTLSQGYLPMFPVTASVVALGILVAVMLGVASSIAPSYASIKTTVIDGLKELD
jgi:hypothetical protein